MNKSSNAPVHNAAKTTSDDRLSLKIVEVFFRSLIFPVFKFAWRIICAIPRAVLLSVHDDVVIVRPRRSRRRRSYR